MGRCDCARKLDIEATLLRRGPDSNGRPLQDWLGARRASTDCPSCGDLVGESVCCSALSVGETVHESLAVDHVTSAAPAVLGLGGSTGGCCA